MTHLRNSSTRSGDSRVARAERQNGGEHQRARDGNVRPVGWCQPIVRWKEDIRAVNADTRFRFSPFSFLQGHSRCHSERARYAREAKNLLFLILTTRAKRRTCFF